MNNNLQTEAFSLKNHLPEAKSHYINTKYGKIHLNEQLPILQNTNILPSIICFHGEGKNQNWRRWLIIMKPLALKGFRVISLDFPGYGESSGSKVAKSETNDLIKIIANYFDIKELIIIGSAIGATLALEAAIKNPSLIKSIIVSHPVAVPKDILKVIKQPVLITWAIDDRWGQPYFGTYGASWFVKNLPDCDLISWKEKDFNSNVDDFYGSVYCQKAFEFLKQKKKFFPIWMKNSKQYSLSSSSSSFSSKFKNNKREKSLDKEVQKFDKVIIIDENNSYFDFEGNNNVGYKDNIIKINDNNEKKKFEEINKNNNDKIGKINEESLKGKKIAKEFEEIKNEFKDKIDKINEENIYGKKIVNKVEEIKKNEIIDDKGKCLLSRNIMNERPNFQKLNHLKKEEKNLNIKNKFKSLSIDKSLQNTRNNSIKSEEKKQKVNKKVNKVSTKLLINEEKIYEALIEEEFEDSSSEKIISYHIQTKYGDIHILESGKKNNEVIFLLHGDGKTSSNKHWEIVMKPLSKKGYNLYNISMPGYGISNGSSSSFRNQGEEVLLEIMEKLKINKGSIIGRSVGGRIAMNFAYKYSNKVKSLILEHPVVPNQSIISGIKNNILLSWAKDDGSFKRKQGFAYAGHPFHGPHGAAYIVNLTGCDLASWKESDFLNGDPSEYFRTIFVEKVHSFLIKK